MIGSFEMNPFGSGKNALAKYCTIVIQVISFYSQESHFSSRKAAVDEQDNCSFMGNLALFLFYIFIFYLFYYLDV